VRTFSYGGGVQSTAVLVLAAQGKVQYDHFLFANVGEDSEHPDTLKYFKNVAMPFAEQHGIDLQEVRKYRNNKLDTLRTLVMENNRDIPIPAYLESGAPGNRKCTERFKIRVIDRWVKDNRNGNNKYTVGLGISTDEMQRARSKEPAEVYKGLWKEIEYPLLDLRISRNDCRKIITGAGLPIPPKSSCYFCPFHNDLFWHELKQNHPEQFEDAVKIEKHLQAKREKIGKDTVYLHRKLKPLDKVIPDQPFLFNLDEDSCESGYCFT
jgi:hypothetical protein